MSNFLSFIKSNSLELAVGVGAVAIATCSIYSLSRCGKTKKITRIIDTMEAFKKSSVQMKDPDLVEEMVSLLIKGGAARLQVISDFDHTITKINIEDPNSSATYGILEGGGVISEENKYQAQLLQDYYYPIEIDPHLSVEEKIPYMIEWYTKSHNLMKNYGLKKGDISKIVNNTNPLLRAGCSEMFHILSKHDVPLLIFSAGLGDILKEILKQQNLLYPNMKIIANFMDFNEQDKMRGFKNEIIHTFNKNQSSIQNGDYFEHLKTRNNIILLGDSVGDIDMAGGVKDANCILKIGFLNQKIDENLPKFLKAFDIVLLDDQTMDLINALLQSIL